MNGETIVVKRALAKTRGKHKLNLNASQAKRKRNGLLCKRNGNVGITSTNNNEYYIEFFFSILTFNSKTLSYPFPCKYSCQQ